MELRLKSFYQSSHGPQLIDLFGYCTQGMPSLEVRLHARTCGLLKEKLMFLTRVRKMRLPPRRYVLCMDFDQMRCSQGDFSDFELPFLVLFWSLAEVLPIRKLDDCVCLGKVCVDGLIIPGELGPEHIHRLYAAQERMKIIGVESEHLSPFSVISLNSLMKGVRNIRVEGQ